MVDKAMIKIKIWYKYIAYDNNFYVSIISIL